MKNMFCILLILSLFASLTWAQDPDKLVVIGDAVQLSASASDADCHFESGKCPHLESDSAITIIWSAVWRGTSTPAGSFPNGSTGKSATWNAPPSPGDVTIRVTASNSQSTKYPDGSASDSIWVRVSPARIIAVCAGQDFMGTGTQDLWDSLGTEAWASNASNIVGWFRCDADWDPFGNAEWWIQDQKEAYPNAKVIITGHSNGGDAARKVAANLANDNINVDLLFLFDMVPKPWEFGEPGTRSKPVSNAAVAVENFQRDDIRTLGIWPLETWLQGWLITGGSNSQFTTHYPPHGPGAVNFVEPGTNPPQQRVRYPHTEMVYDGDLKEDLRNAINSINP